MHLHYVEWPAVFVYGTETLLSFCGSSFFDHWIFVRINLNIVGFSYVQTNLIFLFYWINILKVCEAISGWYNWIINIERLKKLNSYSIRRLELYSYELYFEKIYFLTLIHILQLGAIYLDSLELFKIKISMKS